MAEKRFVDKEIESFYPSDLVGSVDAAIKLLELKKLNAENLMGFRNITIKVNGYEEQYFELWGERLETDDEFEHRMKILKKNIAIGNAKRARKKEQEREQLKRLLAKYPDMAE